MKIVITGALGHIGSKLIRHLPEHFDNLEISMIDDMTVQRYPSLFDLPDTAKYSFVEGDVTEMDLGPAIEDADFVVHLAAITDATKSFEMADEVERVNFTATKKVAEACLEYGVSMIHASTTSVYGTQDDQVDEDCGVEDLNPQSPYAETKMREEELIADYASNKGLKAITFRFGTIFGTSPGMRFHTAVNKFCWQSVMGIPVTVWKTAYNQKRPYLDLSDAVRAVAFMIQKNQFDGRIYNVVTANATVEDVVEHIRSHIPDLGVEFVDTKIMNQLSYEVLNTRMTKIGFQPEGNMAGGISDTIQLLRASNGR